jgi:hypothetical protein
MALKHCVILTLDSTSEVEGFECLSKFKAYGAIAKRDADNNVLISYDAFMNVVRKEVLKTVLKAVKEAI